MRRLQVTQGRIALGWLMFAYLASAGTIISPPPGSITDANASTDPSTAIFYSGVSGSMGTFTNFFNYGQITNADGSTMSAPSGSTIYNYGGALVTANGGSFTIGNGSPYGLRNAQGGQIVISNSQLSGGSTPIYNDTDGTIYNGTPTAAPYAPDLATFANGSYGITASGGTLTGTLENYGNLYSQGDAVNGASTMQLNLTNNAGGYVLNSVSNFQVVTQVTNYGVFLNNNQATITNSGSGTTFLTTQTTASITNDGGLTAINNQNGAYFTVDGGAAFANQNGAAFNNNQGYLTVGGAGTVLTNTGSGTTLINSNGGIVEADTINNTNGATLTNTGTSPGGIAIFGGSPASYLSAGTLTNDNSSFNVSAGATASIGNLVNQNGGVVTIDGGSLYPQTSVTNSASLIVQNSGNMGTGSTVTINNTGYITISSGGEIFSSGTMANSGAGVTILVNGGALENWGSGATFTNSGGAAITVSPVSGNAFFDNGSGGVAYNKDAATSFESSGGNFLNTGTGTMFYNQGGAQFLNDTGGFLDNTTSAQFVNDGTGTKLINSSSAVFYNENGATFLNQNGAVLTNDGSLDPATEILNQTGATLTNNSTFNNSGTVDNKSTIDGTGTYTQTAGTTTNEAGASFTQGSLSVEGGNFIDYGSLTITGAATTSGGSIFTCGSGASVSVGSYTQTGTGSGTVLSGCTLFDPPSIDIEGGTFGGTGTVSGSLTLTNATLEVGSNSDPTGQLHLEGNYSQTGGSIVFDVSPDGHGGFTESTLDLNPGGNYNFGDALVEFDFINGASESTFDADHLNVPDTFFKLTDNSSFDSSYAGALAGVTYEQESSATPEPGSLGMVVAGLGLGFCAYRRFVSRRISQ